jgi:hypothetical protein
MYKKGGDFINLNILISTIISSTAALVAIIGGFLVSRVITLSSEKNAIVRRLREIDNELNNKKKMLDRIELILLEEDVDDFIHEHAKEILIEEISIKDILDSDDSTDLTEDELKPYIEKLYKIFKHLMKLIEETANDYALPSNFDDFVKNKGIKIDEKKNWYELVYRTIWNALPEATLSNPLWGVNLKPLISNSALINSVSPVTSQIYRDRVKERDKLEDEIQILTGMKEEQEKILRDYGKVSGLWGGLAVLIYACIVGITIPSTLLPYPLNTFDDVATKQHLLALFFSELIALFVYLAVSMYKLTKK